MAQKLNMYVCIYLGWAYDWIIELALFVLKRTFNCRANHMEKFN